MLRYTTKTNKKTIHTSDAGAESIDALRERANATKRRVGGGGGCSIVYRMYWMSSTRVNSQHFSYGLDDALAISRIFAGNGEG